MINGSEFIDISGSSGGGGALETALKELGYDEETIKMYVEEVKRDMTDGPTSSLAVYYPMVDTSQRTSFVDFFNGYSALRTIPPLDTSKGTSFTRMFKSCRSLRTVPFLDTSKGTNFQEVFGACSSLTAIPKFDFSNGTDFRYAFAESRLPTVPDLDLSKCTMCEYMFRTAAITTIGRIKLNPACTRYAEMFKWVDFSKCGGFIGLAGSLDIQWSKLDHESLMNILNGLEAVTTKQTLTLGSTNLAKLTDEEKAIAIGKGWTLA